MSLTLNPKLLRVEALASLLRREPGIGSLAESHGLQGSSCEFCMGISKAGVPLQPTETCILVASCSKRFVASCSKGFVPGVFRFGVTGYHLGDSPGFSIFGVVKCRQLSSCNSVQKRTTQFCELAGYSLQVPGK